MKTRTILIAITLLLSSFVVEGQEFMDALKQTAEMHNESKGISDNNGGLSDQQQEAYTASWEDLIKEAQEEFKADLNGLGDYEKCFAMMVIYLDQLYLIQKRIDNEANCKMKYDLYGMQLMAISAGNTFLYCPEKLSNLSVETQREAYDGFLWRGIGLNSDEELESYGHLGEAMLRLTENSAYKFDSYSGMEWLINHFRPLTTASMVLTIGQKMEALGCGG